MLYVAPTGGATNFPYISGGRSLGRPHSFEFEAFTDTGGEQSHRVLHQVIEWHGCSNNGLRRSP